MDSYLEIGNLHRLKSIDVQANNFTGLIPESFGNLSNVQLVTLATNSLTGI
jgi:Leucine-rich repeat (LRR) protein